MAKDYLYPDISLQVLRQLELMRRLHLDHPDYFLDSACPYSEEVERHFRSWFDKPLGTTETETAPRYEALKDEDDRWEALYREVVDLYTGLKNAKPSAGDSTESMAYFRTATGLLDKLVSHQERCLGIKQLHEFHQTVLQVMENVMTPDQRNTVMAQLKEAVKQS